MMRFFSKKPKEKFSLENLKYLYDQLVKDPIITNSNKARLVEVLRSIAELMIWGDQHNPAFFDYFAEKNILANFVRILSQKCDNKVKVQVIQTLSILVQNLANEVSIFYLLSNNYINDMIVHRFDFADEEIVTYYINFMKCWSKGTELLMFDGSSKVVESIRVNDRLMGPDGRPRTVLATPKRDSTLCGNTVDDAQQHTGPGPLPGMYRIDLCGGGRTPFTVNNEHILVLHFDCQPSPVESTTSDDGAPSWRFDQLEFTRAATGSANKVSWSSRAFDSKEVAEAAHKVASASEPAVWECTVHEFLSYEPTIQDQARMFQPSGGVSFQPPTRSLSERLLASMSETRPGQIVDSVPEELVRMTAWVIGIWLASGSTADSDITVPNDADPALSHTAAILALEAWYSQVYGVPVASGIAGSTPDDDAALAAVISTQTTDSVCTVRCGPVLRSLLDSYGLLNNRHIPLDLLRESREVRMALMAGVIDGKGEVDDAGYALDAMDSSFVSSGGLSHLCRGLGFTVGDVCKSPEMTMTTSEGLVLPIRGERLDLLETVLPGKRLPLSPTKTSAIAPSPHSTHTPPHCDRFTVTRVDHSDYYGFKLDGDGRCLLSDFVVTHNSLSFKLNPRTILFFYNEHAQDFPLFNEAVKFFNHADSMIRIAVRTLTLNVFRINDLSLRRYLLTKNCVPYFAHLVWFLRDQTVEFDKLMHSSGVSVSKLEVHMEHLLDQLYYMQDILNCNDGNEEREGGGFAQRDDTGKEDAGTDAASHASAIGGLHFQHLISEVLIDQLLGYYVLPLLLGSLVPGQSQIPAHMLISTRLSFFLLNHVLSIFSHCAFVNTIVSVLVKQRLAPLTIKLIQEPPRGPIRNSDGTPLTDVLYPKSAPTRRANVEPELALLANDPNTKKHRNNNASSSASSAAAAANASTASTATSTNSTFATPKPVRPDRDSVGLFESPSPTDINGDDADDPSDSVPSFTPPPVARSPSETELQPITFKAATPEMISPTAGKHVSVDLLPAAASDVAQADSDATPASTIQAAATSGDAASPNADAPSEAPTTSAPADLEPSVAAAPADSAPVPSTGAAASPLPVDGWPCAQCTFVNPASFLACGACQSVRPQTPLGTDSDASASPATSPDVVLKPSTPPPTAADTPVTPVIANPNLASAYLSPTPSTGTAGSASVSASPVPPSSSSASKSPSTTGAREMPVDENSKARSKLPEVGPLYSPIDYFGCVRRSELTPAAAAAAAANAAVASSSFSSSPVKTSISSGSFTVPGLIASSVELDQRLLDETEPNEYAQALRRYLARASRECDDVTAALASPLHVLGQAASEDRSPDPEAPVDERDLYGSLSLIYSLLHLRSDSVDVDMLVQAGLCSQTHRQSRHLLAALVSNGSAKDILELENADQLDRRPTATDSRPRATTDDIFFSSPSRREADEEDAADKLEEDKSEAKDASKDAPTTANQEPTEVDFLTPTPVAAPDAAPADSSSLGAAHSKDGSGSDPSPAVAEADRLESQPHSPTAEVQSESSSDPVTDKALDDAMAAVTVSSPVEVEVETRPRSESSDPLMRKSPQKRSVKPSPLRAASVGGIKFSSPSTSRPAKGGLFAELDLAAGPFSSDDNEHAPAEYDHELVSHMLSLVQRHPPYRLVTLRTMVELLQEVVFVPDAKRTFSSSSATTPEPDVAPLAGISRLISEHAAQLDRIYARLIDELRVSLTTPVVNLFLLDLVEEEYPQLTSAGPNYGDSGRSTMLRFSNSLRNLMHIETGFARDVPMEFRVQSSGVMALAKGAASSAVDFSSSSADGGSPAPPVASLVTSPIDEVERLRKLIQVLLIVRNLRLKTRRLRDTLLYPLPSAATAPKPENTSPALRLIQTQLFHEPTLRVSQEILTSHHPDAMLCTLHVEMKKKVHLFFVVDEFDCIFVELQQHKPGTAIVQFRQSLRHQEAFLNRNNACLLHVTIRSPTRPHAAARRLSYPSESGFKPLWVVSLLFLDAIQCARAWKHLDTRRTALRKQMLTRLVDELFVDQAQPAPLDAESTHAIAAACTAIQAYPAVEADVHADSLLFGIPNLPPAMVAPPTPPMHAIAANVPASAATTTAPLAVAPLPVATPVAGMMPTPVANVSAAPAQIATEAATPATEASAPPASS